MAECGILSFVRDELRSLAIAKNELTITTDVLILLKNGIFLVNWLGVFCGPGVDCR